MCRAEFDKYSYYPFEFGNEGCPGNVPQELKNLSRATEYLLAPHQ
jgi:hypothetical protein